MTKGSAVRSAATGAALMMGVAGCGVAAQQPATPTLLRDVTATHVPSAPTLHALDIALADVDGDGDLDAVLAVEGEANRLYINDGRGRFTWKQGAFGSVKRDTEHVRTADFNRDGHADFVFVTEDDRVHQLYLGRGDGSFIDASDRIMVRGEANGLAVGDVNGDGLADIVIGTSGTKGDDGDGQNFLLLNDPARPGHFIDATKTHLPEWRDDTQGLALADVDGDGDPDLVIGNEVPKNRLLLNDGSGTFAEGSDRLQLVTDLHTREAHVFDANGDGRADILFFNLTSNAGEYEMDPQNRLLIQDAEGRFVDETDTRLPTNDFSSWGGTVMDVDGDGHSDLIVGAIAVPGFEPMRLRAYLNDGQGMFRDATEQVMPDITTGRHWSMATGDVNGDGIEDLFVGGWGTQLRLLLGTRAVQNPARPQPVNR